MLPAVRDSLAEVSSSGAFVRTASLFRARVTEEQTAPGRLALYVSYACPWASRCTAVIALKGLEHVVRVVPCLPTWAATAPGKDEHRGWVFRARAAGPVEAGWDGVPLVDPIFGAETVRGVYDAAEPDGVVSKFTVPLLVDTLTRRVVCNESSIIIRDLNERFNGAGLARFPALDLYPAPLAHEIDAVNDEMYESINNGVYKCGFATTQAAYEEAAHALSAALGAFNARLGARRWLVGGRLTEADIRLFMTLVRYDPVYVVHFKTSFNVIRHDFPALLGFMRDVYQASSAGADGGVGATVGSTVHLDHIKRHYFCSHTKLNPYSVVPAPHPAEGVELTQPHGREGMA